MEFAEDPIPSGFIPLRAAYDLYVQAIWRGGSPIADLENENIYRDADPSIVEIAKASQTVVTDRMASEFFSNFRCSSLDAVKRSGESCETADLRAGLADGDCFVRHTQLEPWLDAHIERSNLCNPNSPLVIALNDYLFCLASHGLVSSGKIESWAEQWGLPPLASKPDPESHNPLNASRWTLCMTVSWIVWRNVDAVRDAMNDYRSECREWRHFHRRLPAARDQEDIDVWGEELLALEPLSLWLLAAYEAVDEDAREGSKMMSVKSGCEELWRALGSGDISASGFTTAGQLSTIPAQEWTYLELASDAAGRDYLVYSHNPNKPIYTRVTILKTPIFSIWDGSEQLAKTRPSPRAKRGGKPEAARQALAEIYAEGIPAGLTAKERLTVVNNHLQEKGSSKVSLTTILRALGNK